MNGYETRWTTITESTQVTEEILAAAIDVENGWGADQIEWEGFWSQLSAYQLSDGSLIDLGTSLEDTPAMRRIKRHVRRYRAGLVTPTGEIIREVTA